MPGLKTQKVGNHCIRGLQFVYLKIFGMLNEHFIGKESINIHNLHTAQFFSLLSKCCTARESTTRFSLVGPTKLVSIFCSPNSSSVLKIKNTWLIFFSAELTGMVQTAETGRPNK